MYIFGALIIAVILYFSNHDLLVISTGVFVVGAVAQSIPRRYTNLLDTSKRRRFPTREEGEEYYHQVAKEIGVESYSPAELRQMKLEERYTHDKNAASEAAQSPIHGATWIDSYGNVRDASEKLRH